MCRRRFNSDYIIANCLSHLATYLYSQLIPQATEPVDIQKVMLVLEGTSISFNVFVNHYLWPASLSNWLSSRVNKEATCKETLSLTPSVPSFRFDLFLSIAAWPNQGHHSQLASQRTSQPASVEQVKLKYYDKQYYDTMQLQSISDCAGLAAIASIMHYV